MAPVITIAYRMASYHGTRLAGSTPLTTLRSDTAIDGKLIWSPDRWNAATGGTCGVRTDWPMGTLVHFPACFSSWLNDILRLSIASDRIASSLLAVYPMGRRACVAPYRN